MTAQQAPDDVRDGVAHHVMYIVQAPPESRAIAEVHFAHVLGVLWRRRWWIAACTALMTLTGAAYAMLATPSYRAEAFVLQREGNSNIGLSGQLSGLSGLADLAGINLGSSGSKQEPLGLLRSKGFARRFIESNGLLDTLAEDLGPGVDSETQRGGGSPDVRKVVEEFTRSVVSIQEDKKSGLVIVAVTWTDPAVAAEWANKMIAQVNSEMRERALHESEGNIRYLREQLAGTDLVSIQQSISRVLETEMQKLMLANITSEYAFRVIDAAEPPARRSKPRRSLIVLMAFATGLIASVFLALTVDPIRRAISTARRE